MKTAEPIKKSWSQRLNQDWERFWFAPSDPTLLGLIRITCGIITLYTMIAYTFDLQAFMGEHAWLDLQSRLQMVRERPNMAPALGGKESPLAPPRTADEHRYVNEYRKEFHHMPPGPYPRSDEDMDNIHRFRRKFNFDLRTYGLPPPKNVFEKEFLEEFAQRFHLPPAPPYPRDKNEAERILQYMQTYNADPNRLIAKGSPIWSLWYYVTDPAEMMMLHAAFVVVALLFLLGFCTRLTSALTWFASLNYMHRSPVILFGADTMMNILLLYLMIGPSGSALSVDRLIACWWSRNKSKVVNAWRGLWKLAPLAEWEIRPAYHEPTPQPQVSATVAIRLLQVHLCIIYLVAGIAKLLGVSWWNGTAVWGAIANFEFAPMHIPAYNAALRFLGHNEFVFALFLFTGTYFTLVFEIGYAFLIWKDRFRWLILGAAILLHGFIGTLMGLKTFALIMLVMNMAFLRAQEARWLVDKVRWFWGLGPKPEPDAAAAPMPTIRDALQTSKK